MYKNNTIRPVFAGMALLFVSAASAQVHGVSFPDSVTVKVRPHYDKVNRTHRWMFGENYRKEWATPVKVPLIRLSEIAGGLRPVREGGGMQSRSLRLVDAAGRGWVIRSVEKIPDKVLPANLRGTFIVDWFDDAMSSQHPFSALSVPPLASAAGVPHTDPVIGVIAADPLLAEFSKEFEQMLVLLELREPAGRSENTFKMEADLLADHDNRLNSEAFLKARLLDLLLGDWDRHEDQWRWAVQRTAEGKIYTGVPRDRDQVFHVQEGIGPSVAAVSWINPLLDHFDGEIPRPKYSLGKTRFVQAYPDMQFSFEEWMRITRAFIAAETDEVLEAGLRRLPPEVYALRHDELLAKLKKRRDNIPAAMENYYRFINRTVDLRLSDKNESVSITDGGRQGVRVVIDALDKKGNKKAGLLAMTYLPEFTKEIRIYVEGGSDKITADVHDSPIRVRIIGRAGEKNYTIGNVVRKISIYDRPDSIRLSGSPATYRAHLSADTLNTRYVQNDPYNIWMPLATAAINRDDGFLLGAGFRYTGRQGFRKTPYATRQEVMLTHSFATAAFRMSYQGEWTQLIGKADLVIGTQINAPNNTTNFFGRGNGTVLQRFDGYRTFYRTRYDTYQFDPALRWHLAEGTTMTAGPSLQFYHLDIKDNYGRFITRRELINAYDSATVDQNKAHIGLSVNFLSDKRDQAVLPSKGYLLDLSVQGYTGLNAASRAYLQIRPSFTWYQQVTPAGILVLSDRIGGGISAGQPAFYQSMFLGGQGNLLGYLQNRFAGDHMIYNNFQARLRLFNIASYILPGQLGLTGFNDTGRVWVKGENNGGWHNGYGGGIYFAPASLAVVQLLAGHSKEGWYPYISLNVRL